jgi:penicillin amidase
LHTATFEHPIGSVKPLNLIFNAGPFPMGGDGQTIFNTRFADADPYGEQTVPSLRAIYDVSNWNNSQWMHTTGESGQPLSKHYTDMIPLWRAVQYAPMPFDRAAVEQAKEGVLVLEP